MCSVKISQHDIPIIRVCLSLYFQGFKTCSKIFPVVAGGIVYKILMNSI